MNHLDMTEESHLLNLLEESFPGIKANIIRCEKIGYPWRSKRFLKEEKGKIFSHVGLLEYPMQIEGQQHKAAALHAICTKAKHRSQGLSSKLIQEVASPAVNHLSFTKS